MKHSGLAAELHVVHRTFLVDTEGKEGEEGESRERQVTRAHGSIPHRGAEPSPAPALPADFQLCPAAHKMQGHRHTSPGYQAAPLLHVWPRGAPGRRAKARREASPISQQVEGWASRWQTPLRLGLCQVTNCSPHTCPGALTSPFVSPHPQTARNRTSLIFHD